MGLLGRVATGRYGAIAIRDGGPEVVITGVGEGSNGSGNGWGSSGFLGRARGLRPAKLLSRPIGPNVQR